MSDDDKTIRGEDDQLGYDTRQPWRGQPRAMAEDAIAGRHQDGVGKELAAIRERWGKLSKTVTPTAR
ncbi:hypothetical protein [Rhizobium leguminosarum]|uniref:hypothetical protein n=1 Tax=Rhizobium leguminosarum TaxID=384 RepID=UPI001C95F707|nr:hypothetical protein [Rhizobium leguminosarum]MBY5318205.1 hypothetical protein [Rhizobium leguminosarum]